MKRRTFIKTATGAAALVGNPTAFELFGQSAGSGALEKTFQNPPADAGLSIVYHWTGGVVTKEGITADLEGMAASGIDIVNWFYFDGSGIQDGIQVHACKSPEWWDLVDHLMSEAKRVGLKVAPHVCSSWGPAGTEGITPELSQQVLCWSEVEAEGGKPFTGTLPRPQRPAGRGRGGGAPPAGAVGAVATGAQAAGARGTGAGGGAGGAGTAAGPGGAGAPGGRRGPTFPPFWSNYYRDQAVLAFPIPADWGETSVTRKPKVTTNLPITDLAKAVDPANNERIVTTDKAGWIQFAFDQPFTLRAVTVNPGGGGGGGFGAPGAGGQPSGNPHRTAHGLEVQASDDGTNFRKIGQCEPMCNGWQTTIPPALAHSVTQTTARFFRLVYNPIPPKGYDEGMRTGTRQGNADLNSMIEPLGLASVVLSSTPTVHLLPAKNNATWGRGRLVSDEEIPPSACVPLDSIVDLTNKLRDDGTIDDWTPPPGRWRVQRFGYLSQMSTTGGGLQCDKYSADAARVVFKGWVGEMLRRIPDGKQVIKVLNIDSYEGGSLNWSPVLPEEFRSRRGYDLTKYLPCMTGVMVQSGGATEGFLLDLRRTLSECLSDNHFGTFHRLAQENGLIFMSESINQAFNCDDMEYFKNTDWPGGEFWVRATQNWKPNDISDPVSAARMYGKKVIFAEAWTGGRWDNHPFALKAMGDHHFAEGLNRMMLHVWNEQYYPKRVPGQPGAGTPFNMLNTWWKPGRAWLDYLKKVQALLQQGQPVEDALYYSGENIPARALLPPKLGWVWAADPPMPEGYKLATINRDALLNLARVQNGRIVMSGLSYRLLVLRANEPYLTPHVALKIKEMVEAGAVVVGPKPTWSPSLEMGAAGQATVKQVADQVWGRIDGKTVTENRFGKGRVFWGKPMAEILAAIGAAPDVQIRSLVETATGKPVVVNADAPSGTNPVLVGEERKGWGVEFCHRQGQGFDIYFLSNQEYFPVSAEVSFRITSRIPELWNPETGTIEEIAAWQEQNGRTIIPMNFDPSGAVFVVFRKASAGADPVVEVAGGKPVPSKGLRLRKTAAGLEAWVSEAGSYTLKTKSGNHTDEDVKFFSGTATYSKEVTITAAQKAAGRRLLLDLGDVQNLARVRLNGKDLGVLWKAPYVADITAAAIVGANKLELEVTNTWANRIAGDEGKPQDQRVTWAGSAGRGRGGATGRPATPAAPQLLPAGLIGPVRLVSEVKAIV
ncbi:MAG: hypothetical protein H6Q05_3594 [Acidobacteria bacterium]|nr:hypothetical protein [Acidobacteriota bacterium]